MCVHACVHACVCVFGVGAVHVCIHVYKHYVHVPMEVRGQSQVSSGAFDLSL